MSKYTNLLVHTDTKEALKAIAKKKNIPLADLLNFIVQMFEKHEKLEQFKKEGITVEELTNKLNEEE